MPATDQCSLRPRAGGAQGKGGASGLQWHVPRAANVSRRVWAGVPRGGGGGGGRRAMLADGKSSSLDLSSFVPSNHIHLPQNRYRYQGQPNLNFRLWVHPTVSLDSLPPQRSTEGKSAAHRHPGRSKGKRRAEAPERARRCGSRRPARLPGARCFVYSAAAGPFCHQLGHQLLLQPVPLILVTVSSNCPSPVTPRKGANPGLQIQKGRC